MENGLTQMLQQMAPILIALLTLAALIILWRKHRSVWLVVAIVADLVGLAFRGVLFAMPDIIQSKPAFFSLWTLASLTFAAAFLGYAIETAQRTDR